MHETSFRPPSPLPSNIGAIYGARPKIEKAHKRISFRIGGCQA